MKITQKIEIEIQGQVFVLTKEEAQKLLEALDGILNTETQKQWGERLLEKYKEELEKPIPAPRPAMPQFPHEPIWPPNNPWPKNPPIWCGLVTMDTHTAKN